ncbi:hypothetical protein C8J56DRAFT_934541 [Mycena floridula]|nr:hypothetical protein C8J56DRAFT_934541 [Mycena floridula]
MVKPTTEPSQAESTSTKRRKLDDTETSHGSNKKQRTRISFSCGECHRRKQKCDRQMPCSHCVARKVPELCKAYTPGKADQDISVRLSRLEHIIEMALPQFCASGNRASSIEPTPRTPRSSSFLEDDNRSQPEEQDPTGGSFQSGKWYGNSASGSIAPASVLEQLQNAFMPGAAADNSKLSLDSRFNDANQPAISNGISSDPVAGMEPSAADNLKTLVQECGVSPHKISELLQELPPVRSSDVLIDYYFRTINWTRYPISEQDFRAAYMSICKLNAQGLGIGSPNDVRFLSLLFVVLAIAVRLAPEDVAGDSRTRRVTSLRYYWSSRRSLLIAAAIQPDSLDVVLTRLLSARFLTFDRRITECWSQLGAAVRTAQALGFHRDGAAMGMEASAVEYRRRIWSYLYHADRSYALVLGRPHSIQDDYTSTQAPSNIEDESPAAYNRPAPPLSTPTPMTFVILRHHLATIIGRIVHHFQKVRTATHYSEVTALDDELLKFIMHLPPHYALEPDRSLDESFSFIPVHRFLLITEILFVRTSLHRPYILRKLNSDRYSRSRAACFESAIKDFEVRQAFRQAARKETRESLSNAYREFQTAMISGIYLVLDPMGKHADAMHTILDSFTSEHEGMREIDETTRRELKTIEFLKSRALQRQSSVTMTNGSSENPAHVLLSLQNSTPVNHNSFPSLFNLSSMDSTPQSPTMNYGASGSISSSPTFHRLQHSAPGEYAQSPTTSGSPSADDESTAQSLLDHWCNTVSNAPVDAPSGLSWGGPGGADFLGWVGSAPSIGGADPSLLGRLDGSEWNYWEALVNQIQRPLA